MLKINNLTAAYSQAPVLHSININVDEGKIVTLVGANGAGKSTTLKVISGLLRASTGEVIFCDTPIQAKRPDEIVKMGLIHVPEGRLVFAGLTVMENLKMGSYTRKKSRGDLNADFEKVFELFPRLAERKNQLAGTMSGGEQQMLAIGRALMADPKLLMLDEPSLGLAPVIIDAIMDKILEINKLGLTILLIEQNVELALSISHYAYILNVGNVILGDTSENVSANTKVLDMYLGG